MKQAKISSWSRSKFGVFFPALLKKFLQEGLFLNGLENLGAARQIQIIKSILSYLKASQRTQHVIPLVVRVYLHKKIQMQPQPKII